MQTLLHGIKLEVTRDSQRAGNKKAVYVSGIGCETVFVSSGDWRKTPHGRPQGGPAGCHCLSLLLAVPNTSYVNGVVAFVVHLLPAGRASVSVLEGISEALAAEDVATLRRNDDTSVLHNLGNRESNSPHACLLQLPQSPAGTSPVVPRDGLQDQGLPAVAAQGAPVT